MGRSSRGLTMKQELAIIDQLDRIERGEGVNLTDSFHKIFNVKSRDVANVMASQYWGRDNFREALINGLRQRGIIGKGSKVQQRLREGLDATKEGSEGERPDYRARLNYVQEINKIAGVYAPEKSESKKMTLNVNVSDRELDEKIKDLQSELQGETIEGGEE